MTYTQISSKLGEMWRALNDEEREPYWEQHYQDSDRCNEQRAAKGLVPIGKTPQQRQEEQEREKLKEEKKALRELDSAQKQKDKEARAILKEEERVRKANKLEEAQVQREKEKTDKAAQKEEERLQKLEERKRNHNSETGRKTKKRKQSDDDAEDVYEVEQVLDKRTQFGKKEVTEFLVKWKGYSEDQSTWEPQDHLDGAEKLIAAFERKLVGVDETVRCRQWYEELQKGWGDQCLARLTEDVEWHAYGPYESGVYSGHSGVQAFFKKLSAIIDVQESTCDDSSFFHDMVQMSVHVTGKETGVIKTEDQRPYENNFDHTFWFNAEGLICKFRANWNAAKPDMKLV